MGLETAEFDGRVPKRPGRTAEEPNQRLGGTSDEVVSFEEPLPQVHDHGLPRRLELHDLRRREHAATDRRCDERCAGTDEEASDSHGTGTRPTAVLFPEHQTDFPEHQTARQLPRLRCEIKRVCGPDSLESAPWWAGSLMRTAPAPRWRMCAPAAQAGLATIVLAGEVEVTRRTGTAAEPLVSPRLAEDRVSQPISAYALLSNSQGAALVSRDGSIDWACMPRFDSPSTFARLLDPGAGHWRLAPKSVTGIERSYVSGTLVLRAVVRSDTGTVAITDAMPFGADERGHGIGFDSPHAIVRVVEGLDGEVTLENELALRPEYGLTVPGFVPHPGGVCARGGAHVYLISHPGTFECRAGTLRSSICVRSGERYRFALMQRSAWEPLPSCLSDDDIDALLSGTIEAWRSWSELHQRYAGPYEPLVAHSGRVLQGLTYAPTGAIIAAPTTSLPETVGGVRNWDYRYAWVRDTSLTLQALWVAACPDEAERFFDFLATATGERADEGMNLQILYGIGGERYTPEHSLDHLAGYRDSRPVRVGNGAWDQRQLDIYGELLDAAALLADQIGTFNSEVSTFLVDVADAAAAHWREPDQGIWEVRGPPQHFIHSKIMCWVALDRALRLADKLDAPTPVERWTNERDAIRDAILNEGWSPEMGAFTQAFGSNALDASTLMLAITGFLPIDDPRIAATVDVIADQFERRTRVHLSIHARRRGARCGRYVRDLFVLARSMLRDARRYRPGPSTVREHHLVCERCRLARRGDRSGHGRAARQLSPSVHARRTHQRRVRDLAGRAGAQFRSKGVTMRSASSSSSGTPFGALAQGVIAGAVGTAAMDALWFVRYKRDGGEDGFWGWETGATVEKWDDVSAPGQVGKRVLEGLLRRELPDRWARTTNNAVHWLTGLGWGAQYGLLAGSVGRARARWGVAYGSAVWLTSYVVLPLAKLYKPIWEYDARTLAKDYSAHVVYGVGTAAVFAALTQPRPPRIPGNRS